MEDGGLHFRGIPYAVPPVGGNRWKPGRTPDRLEHCWQGVLQYPEQVIRIEFDRVFFPRQMAGPVLLRP